MKIFSMMTSILRALRARPCADLGDAPCWARDPLSHPALEAMSLRELADLPMWRSPARAGPRDTGSRRRQE